MVQKLRAYLLRTARRMGFNVHINSNPVAAVSQSFTKVIDKMEMAIAEENEKRQNAQTLLIQTREQRQAALAAFEQQERLAIQRMADADASTEAGRRFQQNLRNLTV